MNAIPARVAGVDEVVMVTPPGRDGINPMVLAAAKVAGVDRVYRVGGAQAIGALVHDDVILHLEGGLHGAGRHVVVVGEAGPADEQQEQGRDIDEALRPSAAGSGCLGGALHGASKAGWSALRAKVPSIAPRVVSRAV